jgi:hypothetical protein
MGRGVAPGRFQDRTAAVQHRLLARHDEWPGREAPAHSTGRTGPLPRAIIFALALHVWGGLGCSNAQVIIRIGDLDFNVKSHLESGGKLWAGTQKGLYRIDGDTARRIPGLDYEVRSLLMSGGTLWAGSTRGLYRIDGETARRIPDLELIVWCLLESGGKLWAGTYGGLYCIDADTPRRISGEELNVFSLLESGGKLWAGTHKGLYRIDGDTPRRIAGEELIVSSLLESGGKLWAGTNKGLYRIDGDTPRRIPDLDLDVMSLVESGGKLWAGTINEPYRIDGDTARRIPGVENLVWKVLASKGKVWAGTGNGLYRIDGDDARRLSDSDRNASFLFESGGKLWAGTQKGLYRIDEDVRIDVSVTNSESWWKAAVERLAHRKVLVSGMVSPQVRYSDSGGQDPYVPSLPRQFRIILETDGTKFEKKVKDKAYLPFDEIKRSLEEGHRTLYISVIDQWNNRFDSTQEVWVVPGPWALVVVLGSLWIVGFMAILSLAPHSSSCHWILMNPFVRRYASLGLVPVALTVFPTVRRHVLRRYLRGARDDDVIREGHDRYVVPSVVFQLEEFGKRLAERRTLLLYGPSGVGKTAFLLRLAGSYAAKGGRTLPPRRAIPVLLTLRLNEGKEPIATFADELARLGDLTDRALSDWFLAQGGFLILIDGLNEVGEADQKRVVSFVERYKKANHFVVTT